MVIFSLYTYPVFQLMIGSRTLNEINFNQTRLLSIEFLNVVSYKNNKQSLRIFLHHIVYASALTRTADGSYFIQFHLTSGHDISIRSHNKASHEAIFDKIDNFLIRAGDWPEEEGLSIEEVVYCNPS